MRAHEWTRARQRSVRQISGPLSDLAEEETEQAGPDEPSLLSDEAEPGAEPSQADEPAEPAEEEGLPEASGEPPEATEALEQDADEAPLEDSAAGETLPALLDEARPPVAVTREPAATQAPQPPPPTVPPRAHRPPRARSGGSAEQAQLPLGLEPIIEKPPRRSATETREELIQRLLDPHLTLQETAKLLNVCPTTVRRYTNRGLLAHYRTPGNQRRFRLSDVLAFMERQGIPAHGLERKRPDLIEDTREPEEDGS